MNNFVCEECGKQRRELEAPCDNGCIPYAASIVELYEVLGEHWWEYFIGDWFFTAPLGGHKIRWFVQGGLLRIYKQLGFGIGERVAYIWGYDKDENEPIDKRPFFKNRGCWWKNIEDANWEDSKNGVWGD